jgi:glycosyltransferase involved in cell wall biosynthesis
VLIGSRSIAFVQPNAESVAWHGFGRAETMEAPLTLPPPPRGFGNAATSLRRLALVTDAWAPQTNGVVNTLVRLVDHLASTGIEVLVLAPHGHRTVALPSYPEIRIACDPWKAIGRIRAFEPDAVHVATEGPLGFWTVGWLRRRGLRFTTSFHTRYAEYLSARAPVPLAWGYQLVRWFHERAEHTLVSSQTLLRELQGRRVGRRLVYWPRGVDAGMFHPARRQSDTYPLPRPIWLYVGRVAVEKRLEDFLALPLPGTKVVVGDGPARAGLEASFPGVVWRGYRFGEDLAAHFAGADCFVFPSRTETFGNVILEALASGLPVASVPAPGPIDLIDEGVNGAIDDRLLDACRRALRCSRDLARASILRRTLRAGHELFRDHLVPLDPRIPSFDVGVPVAATRQEAATTSRRVAAL